MAGAEPSNVKKARLAAEALGMETYLGEGVFVKPAVLWASSKDGHNAGDVRTPEKEIPSWTLRARHPAYPDQMAFELVYAGGFQRCRMIDPVGKPVELYFDYTARTPEGYDKDYWRPIAQGQNAEYNDGHMWVLNRYYMDGINDLFIWLDQMLAATGVEYKQLAIQRKPKKERTLMDDVMEAVNV